MHTLVRSLFVHLAAGVVFLGPVAVAQDKPAPAPAKPDAAPATKPTEQPAAPPAPGKPITKPSGLIIEDLVIGTGAEVKTGACVVANYIGKLKASGEVFADTYKTEKKEGVVIRDGVGGVIKGWLEGIPGMKIGGKRRLTIPAALAYGDKEFKQGAKVIVPANSDLLYEIEITDMMTVEDLQVGTGLEIKPGGAVVAHYKGTFRADGKVFQSSYDNNGPPAAFSLNGVVRGWAEGVPGMKVGGKRKLVIPYQFAYGDAGKAPLIPGKTDLVFEIELMSVLEMIDLKVGDGAEVPPFSPSAKPPTVKVNYRGTLKEGGKEFDSSYKRNEPLEARLFYGNGGVINGWVWGIRGMKVGGKRKLIIPSAMGYGKQGSPPDIGADADLVFEIELLEVKKE